MKSRFVLASAATLFLCAVAAASALTLRQAQAQDVATTDRAAIEAIVREYIRDNPEIVVEALNAFISAEEAAFVERQKEEIRALLPTLASGATGHAVGAGLGDADVILVEFFDYNCSACRGAAGEVLSIADDDKQLRLVLQELPVVTRESEGVALNALAASEDGYLDLHRALMSASAPLSADDVLPTAKRAGLDHRALGRAITDKDALADRQETINASIDIAASIGIEGTPAFIVASRDGDFIEFHAGYNRQMLEASIAEARNR